MSAPRTRSSSPTSLEQLIKKVYSEVWEQFYDWDATYCQSVIESLRAPSTAPSPALDNNENVTDDVLNMSDDLQGLSIDADNRISTSKFNSDELALHSKVIAEKIKIQRRVRPSDAYESYAPCLRNIQFGDDSDNMQFIPYADERLFDSKDYMGWFGSLSWQNDTFRDPDIDSIEIETVHRLHFDHGVPIEDIDDTGILSVPLSKGKGLIHNAAQRDLLHWQGSAPTEGFPLPRPPVPDVSSTGQRLQSLLSEFCPNLNCIQPYCPVHVTPAPKPPTPQATLTSLDLREQVEHPCGRACFLGLDVSEGEYVTSWSRADREDFHFTLKLMPDTSPCDLAIICRKPCREVYLQRRSFLSDDIIVSQKERHGHDNERSLRKKQKRVKFTIKLPGRLDAIELCAHEGPCNGNNCSCFEGQGYCERNCGCPPTSEVFGDGVDANVPSRRALAAMRDVVVFVLIENVTQNCAGHAMRNVRGICANCDIQRGAVKPFSVLKSRWGLGVFLSVPAEQGDFIGEYIGELVNQRTYDENRQHLSDYRGRNYLYALNKDVCVDSTFAGNHTRFINHSDTPNCRATILIVNGEFRIGVWAARRISRGTELFLNYGESFFKKPLQASSNSPN